VSGHLDGRIVKIVQTPAGPPPSPPEEAFMRLGAFGALALWVLDDEGSLFWIAAGSAEHAVEVLLESFGCTRSDWWGSKYPDVREIGETAGRKLKFYDDDGGSEHSIWEEFVTATDPRVVASTER
jgi:hypothetical protein